MNKIEKVYYNSPIGIIEIRVKNNVLISLRYIDDEEIDLNAKSELPIIAECITQLNEYFQGDRKEFTVSFELIGTEFQKKVWKEVSKIKHGKVRSYAQIAQSIDLPKANRAVGNANAMNKLPIIIPCHRVIGSNGKLTGYRGGIWRKQWLLNHEKNTLHKYF
ncbi:methylated-DNA--[protein]-cysteine S-methyltransferase [Candidatus Hodarchaeum mangrovi]